MNVNWERDERELIIGGPGMVLGTVGCLKPTTLSTVDFIAFSSSFRFCVTCEGPLQRPRKGRRFNEEGKVHYPTEGETISNTIYICHRMTRDNQAIIWHAQFELSSWRSFRCVDHVYKRRLK